MIGDNKGRVLFLVETGWSGMREASLEFFKKGMAVDIIIKGRVKEDILDIISKPGKDYRVWALPRLFFRVYIFFYLLWHTFLQDLDKVIVSKERTKEWGKNFGFDAKLLMETEAGYEIRDNKGE